MSVIAGLLIVVGAVAVGAMVFGAVGWNPAGGGLVGLIAGVAFAFSLDANRSSSS